MAIYVAQEAFRFFGTNYVGGATIDTTGWPQHQVDQLLAHHPVALQAGSGASTPLNYRGAWSSAATYAANDAATDAGLLWLALGAVSSGGAAPSASYVPAGQLLGAVNHNSNTGTTLGAQDCYQQITTGPAGGTIGAVVVGFQSTGGTARVGIATAIGANPNAITWLGSGPSVATPITSTLQSFTLPAPVTLAPSTSYYVVVLDAATNLTTKSGVLTPFGIIASGSATIGYSNSLGGAWSTISSYGLVYDLVTGPPAWTPVPAPAKNVNTVAASGAAVTLPDVAVATMHRVVLSANCTLTFPSVAAGKSFTLALVQDATGSRTVTWPGTVKWPGGVAPTLTTAANKTDVLSFTCIDGTNWYGTVVGQNF